MGCLQSQPSPPKGVQYKKVTEDCDTATPRSAANLEEQGKLVVRAASDSGREVDEPSPDRLSARLERKRRNSALGHVGRPPAPLTPAQARIAMGEADYDRVAEWVAHTPGPSDADPIISPRSATSGQGSLESTKLPTVKSSENAEEDQVAEGQNLPGEVSIVEK